MKTIVSVVALTGLILAWTAPATAQDTGGDKATQSSLRMSGKKATKTMEHRKGGKKSKKNSTTTTPPPK